MIGLEHEADKRGQGESRLMHEEDEREHGSKGNEKHEYRMTKL
jgi:hypothetical protein